MCFQFPPVFLKKTAIVFTPLQSSAQDQIIKLQNLNIKACIFQPEESSNLKKYQIIFVLPETAFKVESLKAIKDQICLLAIDEWFLCQNFLPQLKTECSEIPLLYLTAVAYKDICGKLEMKNALQIETSLDRPNLEYITVFDKIHMEEPLRDVIAEFEANVDKGAMIIYARDDEHVDYMAYMLRHLNVTCNFSVYKEVLPLDSRQKTLKKFSRGEIQVMLGTGAFRVDRSDVRIVVHYKGTQNFDAIFVEQGQAGRDNKPAKCFFFTAVSESAYNSNTQYDDSLVIYLRSDDCRRKYLLSHFKSPIGALLIRESCCDNCLRRVQQRVPLNKMYKNIDKSNKIDLSVETRLILGIVAAFNKTENMEKLLEFLMGTVFPVNYRRTPLEFFGRGKGKSIEWWKKILFMLKTRCLLRCQGFGVTGILRITGTGRKYLKRNNLKVREEAHNFLPFLEKTNREFFIKDDKVFWRYRDGDKRRNIAESIEKSENSKRKSEANDLFMFETLNSKKKKSNDLPGCSKWYQPADQSDEDENDEEEFGKEEEKQLKNLLWAQRVLKKPLKVDFDNLLDYAENYERSDEHMEEMDSEQNEGSESSD